MTILNCSGLLLAGFLSFAACGKSSESPAPPSPPPSPPPQVQVEGKTLFEKNCVACHGVEGRGNGPAAASINPKPADFTLRDTREKCKKDRLALGVAIREGGARKGALLGSVMPPWRNFTEKEVLTLVAYLCDGLGKH